MTAKKKALKGIMEIFLRYKVELDEMKTLKDYKNTPPPEPETINPRIRQHHD